MQNLKHRKKIIAACLAIGVVAVSFMGAMPSSGEDTDPSADTSFNRTIVEVTTPTRGDITVSASFVGTVEAGQSVTVYPKVNGEVLSANFSVGDTVQAGEVLFRVDSTTLEYSIAQTQATLATQQANAALNLEMAQQSLEDFTTNMDDGLNSALIQAESGVIQAEAGVASAELALEQANNAYRTARNNYNNFQLGKYYEYSNETGGDEQVPWSEATNTQLRNVMINAEFGVETAQLALENAKIALETAQTSLELTQRTLSESAVSVQNGVRQAEIGADLTAAYISLEQMQTNLADYTVTAPISGIIEARNVDPFDMVSAGVPSYVISNVAAMTVSFNVTESSLSYMSIGDRITVEKNGQMAYGTVTEISTSTTAGGLYTVKATVSDAPFTMHSGSSVKLYADTQKVENGIMIPIDCVYYDNGTAFVYLFQQGAAVRHDIVTGISDDTHIHVESGLTGGEEIISTWSAGLFDGAEVYLPGTAPAAAAQTPDAADTTGETGGPDGEEELAAGETGDGENADGEERGDDTGTDGEAEEEAA